MRSNKLLWKTFFFSLLVHIAGLSLFAVVLPPARFSKRPVEVSLLPSSMSPEQVEPGKTDVVPDMPEISVRYEELSVPRDKKAARRAPEEFTGFTEYMPVTSISPEFELPDFDVQVPRVKDFMVDRTVASEITTSLDIEGLAGDRKLVYRQDIEYPDWAQKQGLEGNIRIKFWVAPEGRITLTKIVSSSGFPELDIYAEENFRHWLFEAAETDKEVWGIITLRFRLK